jgi:hypothetical protein
MMRSSVDNQNLKRLRSYLDEHADALDANRVGILLSDCWDVLDGGTETKMRADKLWRLEEPSWAPPILEFSIERHAPTVQGSTRANVFRWRVDLETGEAEIIDKKRRQLYAMAKRLDVKPMPFSSNPASST